MLRLMIWLVFASGLTAGEHCFCEEPEIKVVTRYLSIAPVKTTQPDPTTAAALKQQWALVTGAIDLSTQPPPLRRFQFVKNWPTVPPAPQPAKATQPPATTASSTQTQMLYGVIQQQAVKQDGVVVDLLPVYRKPY